MALVLSLIGHWISVGAMTAPALRGIVYLLILIALGLLVRLRVFREKSFFFDVDNPPSSFGKKRVVVFGHAVRDVEIETQEKVILSQSGGQSSSAWIYLINFAIGCGLAGYLLVSHGLFGFFPMLTIAFLFFVLFYSPFLRQLGGLIFVSAFVGFWGLKKMDFEQNPEYLLLVFAIVSLVVLATQYLRAMELARLIRDLNKKEFQWREEFGLFKNSVWVASFFVLSMWVVNAWVPHPNTDPDSLFSPPTPKLFSPKLNRTLAEKMASVTSGNRSSSSVSKTAGQASGGTGSAASAGANSGGVGDGGVGAGTGESGGAGGPTPSEQQSAGAGAERASIESQTGVPSPEPLQKTTGQSQAEETAGAGAGTGSRDGEGSQMGNSEAPATGGEATGSEEAVGQAVTEKASIAAAREKSAEESPVEREKRIQEWQRRLETIFENFKGAFLIVVVALAVVMIVLHFKPQKKISKELINVKRHTLGASDRERLRTLFRLINGRSKGDRQEVIETYNAVLEVFDAANYARGSWNPVDEFSESIERQIPAIGKDFQSLTATFSDVLYGDQEIERLEMEKFRQDVSDVLKYFRL